MNQTKLDLTKKYKSYYTAKAIPEVTNINKITLISIKGQGAPKSEEFQTKIGILYSLAYSIKMQMKKEGKDFTVAKLEGLWWVDSEKHALEVPRDKWCWKLFIRQPEFITSKIVEESKNEVKEKKKLIAVDEIDFEEMNEGKCIQILHIGPYSAESESIAKMKKLMQERNLKENGLHHEIYLSDPRRVSEEKMKTIIRFPVKNS